MNYFLHYLVEVTEMERGQRNKRQMKSEFPLRPHPLFLRNTPHLGAVRYIFSVGHWFQLSLSGISNTLC